MKIRKRTMAVLLGSVVMATMQPLYATDTADPRFITSEASTEVMTTEYSEPATTDAAITFSEGEYVRITQPTPNNDTVTFDSRINIMGVAREGTNITIRVYQDIDDNGRITPDELQSQYQLAEVGATQTFNQLIELQEGMNYIYITYSPKEENIYASINLTIKRESEAKKELMTTYLVGTNIGSN